MMPARSYGVLRRRDIDMLQAKGKLAYSTITDVICVLTYLYAQVQATETGAKPLNRDPIVPYRPPLPTARVTPKAYFPSTRRNQVNPTTDVGTAREIGEQKELAKALALLALPNR